VNTHQSVRFGTLEIFHVTAEECTRETAFWNTDDDTPSGAGWYYWCCLPGCLPEGDPIGPFQTRAAAYVDAVENGYADDDGTESDE
jgi:hypothetical protein